MQVELHILEIEILLYLLNGRQQLGPHADTARKKLNAARREILGPETVPPPSSKKEKKRGI